MLCINCGHQLLDGSDLCSKCGAKAVANKDVTEALPTNSTINSISMSALAKLIPVWPMEIQDVIADEPNVRDYKGLLEVKIRYSITNKSENICDLLDVRLQVLNANEQILDGGTILSDTVEIDPGETLELEESLYGTYLKTLGDQPDKAHVIVAATACSLYRQELDQLTLSDAAFDIIALKPVKLGDVLQLVSGSLYWEPTNRKGLLQILIKVLVQNLTKLPLPAVKLEVQLKDNLGRKIARGESIEPLCPSSISMLENYFHLNLEKPGETTLELALSAYLPIAVGMAQKAGMSISPSSAGADAY
jgi:hypothetical protein